MFVLSMCLCYIGFCSMPKNRCIHEVCYIVDVPPVGKILKMHLNVAKQALETFFPLTSASVRNWYFIWVSLGVASYWMHDSFLPLVCMY